MCVVDTTYHNYNNFGEGQSFLYNKNKNQHRKNNGFLIGLIIDLRIIISPIGKLDAPATTIVHTSTSPTNPL